MSCCKLPQTRSPPAPNCEIVRDHGTMEFQFQKLLSIAARVAQAFQSLCEKYIKNCRHENRAYPCLSQLYCIRKGTKQESLPFPARQLNMMKSLSNAWLAVPVLCSFANNSSIHSGQMRLPTVPSIHNSEFVLKRLCRRSIGKINFIVPALKCLRFVG